MRAWKTIAITGLAIVAVALIIATAFAYASGQRTYAQNGYPFARAKGPMDGLKHGPTGGMMSDEYSPYGAYSYSDNYSQQSPYAQERPPAYGSHGGCPMGNAWDLP